MESQDDDGVQRRRCPLCGASVARSAAFYRGDPELRSCSLCGLVYSLALAPSYSKAYDLGFSQERPFIYPARAAALEDIARRSFALAGGRRLLDVGCGDGHLLSLCQPRFSVVGVEPCADLAEYAARLTGVEVIGNEFEDGVVPRDSFDVVTAIQVLEHVDDPLRFVATARSSLKRGGILVLEVPSVDAPHFLAYRATRIRAFVSNGRGVIRNHVTYWSPSTVRRLLAATDMHLLQVVTGRWGVKYRGAKGRLGALLDPLLDQLGVGGILAIARRPERDAKRVANVPDASVPAGCPQGRVAEWNTHDRG